MSLEGRQLCHPRLARPVGWRFQASRDVSTHCLAVEFHSARDRRDADALAVQFKDHDNLAKSDQRITPPPRKGDIIAHQRRPLARTLMLRSSANLGNFQPAQVGIIRPVLTGGISRAGNERLRCLLVVGATAVVNAAMKPGSKQMTGWLRALLARKPRKVVAVALANKMARIAWVLMTHGEVYRRPATPTLAAAA